MSDVLKIHAPDEADRFQRLGLIGWWDQDKLRASTVLVVGAGALGNEILKNLALLGVGQVVVIDLDRIEPSNLSRSVLYRAKDAGRFKAAVAAEAVRDLYPDCRVHGVVGDVRLDLGLGLFRRADVVIGGLDNREARLHINRACYKVGTPWIDGAIERIDGVAKVFTPPGVCYECTLGKADWEVLRHRRSCAGLSRKEIEGGKTPTTPTVSSIIAGLQVQEAVKLIHDLPTIAGRGWTFNGESAEGWQVRYQRNPDCLSHDPLAAVQNVPTDATINDLLNLAGVEAVELPKTLLTSFECPECGTSERVNDLLERTSADRLECPGCGKPRRPVTFDTAGADCPAADVPLKDLGYPQLDIVTARTRGGAVGYELNGQPPVALPLLGEDEDDGGDDGGDDGEDDASGLELT